MQAGISLDIRDGELKANCENILRRLKVFRCKLEVGIEVMAEMLDPSKVSVPTKACELVNTSQSL